MIKTICKGFAWLFKTILLTMLVAVLTPIVYFAWRAGRPMQIPEFKGLTYYQYLEWRSIAHNELELNYQASHPQTKVKMGVCEYSDRLVTFSIGIEQSLWYTFWSWYDDRNRQAMVEEKYPAAGQPVTWSNVLPSWWMIYEKLILSLAEYKPHTAIVYCRLQPNIPTPEEFEAMKLAHQVSAIQ